MEQFVTWCNMGGYAAYVWSAYGLVAMVLLMNLFAVKRQQKQVRNRLKQWFKQQ